MRALLIALLLACGGISHADCGPNKTPTLCLPFTNWGPVNEAFSRIDMFIGKLYGVGNTRTFVVTDEPFNADRTGQSDTTDALQAALDTCYAAGGGTVLAPSGTYLHSQILVKDKCHLRGAGIGATTFKCSTTESNFCIFLSSRKALATVGENHGGPVYDVSVSDFTLDGQGETRQTTAPGITGPEKYVRGLGVGDKSSRILITNVELYDGGSRALEVRPSSRVRVDGIRCIKSSTVSGNEGDCIHANGACEGLPASSNRCAPDYDPTVARDITVVNNYIEQPGDVGLTVAYWDGAVVTGNTIVGAAVVGASPTLEESCMSFNGLRNAIVSGNRCERTRLQCIVSQSNTRAGTDWIVQNVQFNDNICRTSTTASATIAGIYVQGLAGVGNATRIQINGNQIFNTAAECIRLISDVVGFTVQDNLCWDPDRLDSGLDLIDSGIELGGEAGTGTASNGIVSDNFIVGLSGKTGTCINQTWSSQLGVQISNNQCLNAAQPIGNNAAAVRIVDSNATAFAKLPTAAADGSTMYCSDCDPPANPPTTCASAGAKTGARASRINGAWVCAY